MERPLRIIRSASVRGTPWLPTLRRGFASPPMPSEANTHISTINAEPLHRYKAGGYHPIQLGTFLHDGRYKILHKIGWGGYSTVWAARDRRENSYVAIKICVAEQISQDENQECRVMRALASTDPDPHLMRMLDEFDHSGPNGRHKCLVLELLGPCVPDVIESRFPDGRLPSQLAKSIAKQSLKGLRALHAQKIAHGDVHVRNLAFVLPSINDMSEETFMAMFERPEVGPVRRVDGRPLEHGMPEHLVQTASYQRGALKALDTIKIVDFGQSFLSKCVPRTLHTPLPVRPPEVIFNSDSLDFRVDLWSTGCMLFELFVGQPPFDSIMVTPEILVKQMMEMASDSLPGRWQGLLDVNAEREPGPSLQEWLEELYFDSERTGGMSEEDIRNLGRLIAKLLYFEPSRRASADEILSDPWVSRR